MKAYVIREPGGPEKLELREIPTPSARPGWILIRVRAFGLNRSEYFTRIGESPGVRFPRVLGIECVGEVTDPSDSDLPKGQKVAALMGGMGREFDGSYAEYTLVPKKIILPLETRLDWPALGALPEMIQTTHGSLNEALETKAGQTLLIRGGTSSIGLCALAIARQAGLRVISTTRSEGKRGFLMERGAEDVLVNHGAVASEVRARYPEGVDRVLELIGTRTLLDSLRTLRRGGIACMTGILGGEWELARFAPMDAIPSTVKLTCYMGEASDLPAGKLQEYIGLVENGELEAAPARVFAFDQLVEAHRLMDSNQGNGKLVVTL